MDTIHKQEYRIRDLTTRSVTLFPSRAQVVRDIKDVPLKSGINQITVVGLTPTVDEHSIKVEGTGSAIISDIAVELLPNREIFEEIYPDSDSDNEADDSDDDDDDDLDKDSQELKDVRKKLTLHLDDQKRAKEKIASAESRLKFLDRYGDMLDRKRNVEIDNGLENYRVEREKVFQDHMDGNVRDRELMEQIQELRKVEARLNRQKMKESIKANKIAEKKRKSKEKEKTKERRRQAEKDKEKARVRKERENFFPKQCYTIRITLEAASFTPMSSRRASIASSTELTKVIPEKETPQTPGDDSPSPICDISLSYVTSSAFWSPSYDLQLSTSSNTANLCFDAQLTNMTAETWANCKVILSASQTTFSGLQDNIPTLVPWRVKLSRGRGYDGILNSREEAAQKNEWQVQQNAWVAQKPRAQLFGLNSSSALPPPPGFSKAAPAVQQQQQQQQVGGLFGSSNSINMRKAEVSSSSAFAQPAASALFGARNAVSHTSNIAPAPKAKKRSGFGGGLFSSEARLDRDEELEEDDADEAYGVEGFFDGGGRDDATILADPTPELEFQESSFEETGYTAVHELPGIKTIAPSSTTSKQRVVRLNFAGVVFSHTVVAKYKPVAFLKAKLRNASKITLLKGQAGLTLDGSFMGRSSLPRCQAGDSFSMSLGVDPAIKVGYPKPDVRRATIGLFSKEDSSTYKRAISITNTRASAGNKPVTLVVYDQIPISEDEKLRIEIMQPRGMVVSGPGIPTGLAAKDEKDWGKATASLKKAGEICWDVSLNSGKSVKLPLEYDVALPTGEGVVQC